MGLFNDGRYFDVVQEVAKRTPEDMFWRITVTNHGRRSAPIHVLPTLWFRNIWSWKNNREAPAQKTLHHRRRNIVNAQHESLGEFRMLVDSPDCPKRVPVAVHRKRNQLPDRLRHRESHALRQGRLPPPSRSTATNAPSPPPRPAPRPPRISTSWSRREIHHRPLPPPLDPGDQRLRRLRGLR